MPPHPRPARRVLPLALVASTLVGGGAPGFAPPAACADAEDAECQRRLTEALKWIQQAEKTADLVASQRAAEALDIAERRCPSNPTYPFWGGIARVFGHDTDGAQQALARLVKILAARAQERNRPADDAELDPTVLYLRAAMNLYLANQPGYAVRQLDQARHRDPRFLPDSVNVLMFRARVAYANLLSRDDKWAEAIKQTQLAIEEARYDPDAKRRDQALRNLAQLYRYDSRFKEAAEVFEGLVKRDPKNAVLHYGLAGTYADQLQFEDATREWQTVLRLLDETPPDPRDRENLADSRLRYGICLAHLGRIPEGRKEIEDFLAKNPDDVRALFHLGWIHWEYLEDPDKAIESIEKARALDPICDAYLKALLTLYTVGRRDDAKARAIEDLLSDEAKKKERRAALDARSKERADRRDGCK